jgi:predicted alpha/beta-fold hydrolase
MFGYDSLVSYYTDASIDNKLFDVQVPLLCLNAADDPFSPGNCKYPATLWVSQNFLAVFKKKFSLYFTG